LGYDYWREYILGNVEDQPLPRPWTDFSNDEIDAIAKKAYVSYHSRPLFLIKSTFRVKSFEEFRRKFSAFLEMLFRQENVSTPDKDFEAYHDRAVRKRFFRKLSKWSQSF